jgi:hypothetical protein
MTLEIIREVKLNEGIWYILKADGIIVDCSRKLEQLESMFDQIKNDPSLVKGSTTILKSEEI